MTAAASPALAAPARETRREIRRRRLALGAIVVGGALLAASLGALFGWTAATGDLGAPPVILYFAGIVWTLGYDTIYALQDKDDDAIVGVRSTARLFGTATPIWLAAFFAITLILLAAAGYADRLDWPFYALLPLAALQAIWQIATLKMDEPADCLAKFKSNRWFGWLVLAAIVLAKQV